MNFLNWEIENSASQDCEAFSSELSCLLDQTSTPKSHRSERVFVSIVSPEPNISRL